MVSVDIHEYVPYHKQFSVLLTINIAVMVNNRNLTDFMLYSVSVLNFI